MQTRWALIVADYRREYGLSAEALAGMSLHEFTWLLKGLSEHSRFAQAWDQAPKHVYRESDIAAVTADLRR